MSRAGSVSIRLIERRDAAELAALLAQDREVYARSMPARPDEFYTAVGQDAAITARRRAAEDGTQWPGVILLEGDVIGQITVSGILRGPFEKGFLGYWLSSAASGRGYATRAVELAVTWAGGGLGLHRLEANTLVDNAASQAVLRANGFRSWGIAHEHFYVAGAWRDEIFWERLLADTRPR